MTTVLYISRVIAYCISSTEQIFPIKTRFGKKNLIVDTPGISDTNRTKNQINEAIQR